MKLADLQHDRGRVSAALRKINESAQADGTLTADEQRKWDMLKAELETVEGKIQRVTLLDDLDRRMQGTTIHEPGSSEFEREKRNFSLCKLVASTFDHSVDATREREICTEQRRLTGRGGDGFLIPFECAAPLPRLEQRVLTVAGDGQYLVGKDILGDQFIDALRPMAVATRLGARVITGLTADIALPRRDARTPTAAWFTENNAITSGDQSFDQVTGTPRHLGLITVFGRKTMLQSSPAIEALTREHLMAELAAGLDAGVLKGTGTPPQPRGIINVSGINTVSSGGSAPTWAQTVNVVASVEAADVPQVSLGFALNAYTKAKLRQTSKVTNDAGAGFLADEGGRIEGHPSAITSQLAGDPNSSPAVAGVAIFGNWAEVIVGMWSGIEILVNPYEADSYSKGNVSVRATVDADVLVRHPAAFTYWSGILV